jgi:hypothetical protein
MPRIEAEKPTGKQQTPRHAAAAREPALLDERGSDAGDALRRSQGLGCRRSPKAQKLESQVTLKLPWRGDTAGQELGSLVWSSWGFRLPCPTQSSQ